MSLWERVIKISGPTFPENRKWIYKEKFIYIHHKTSWMSYSGALNLFLLSIWMPMSWFRSKNLKTECIRMVLSNTTGIFNTSYKIYLFYWKYNWYQIIWGSQSRHVCRMVCRNYIITTEIGLDDSWSSAIKPLWSPAIKPLLPWVWSFIWYSINLRISNRRPWFSNQTEYRSLHGLW